MATQDKKRVPGYGLEMKGYTIADGPLNAAEGCKKIDMRECVKPSNRYTIWLFKTEKMRYGVTMKCPDGSPVLVNTYVVVDAVLGEEAFGECTFIERCWEEKASTKLHIEEHV